MLDSEVVQEEVNKFRNRMEGQGVSVLMKSIIYTGCKILDASVMILKKLERMEER